MNLYKKVILDFETTGLSFENDEILQVTAIDQDENILINEYCKPEFLEKWEEAENIHGISPEMVSDKKFFKEYTEILSDILSNAEEIIIYNAEFEIGFLNKYGVKYNNNIYDLMLKFAEVYGQWNEYYGNYTWKSLNDCCLYYGYYLGNAHNSLDDCKATLYCYNKLINNEEQYQGNEYIGKTFKEFLNETWKKVDNKSITLKVYPIGAKRRKDFYFYDMISTFNDIKYKELLDSKIHEVLYTTPRNFSIWVDRCMQYDCDLLQNQIEDLKEKNSKLEKENSKLAQDNFENYRLYIEENKKVIRLEKRITKMKEELGLVKKENSYV